MAIWLSSAPDLYMLYHLRSLVTLPQRAEVSIFRMTMQGHSPAGNTLNIELQGDGSACTFFRCCPLSDSFRASFLICAFWDLRASLASSSGDMFMRSSPAQISGSYTAIFSWSAPMVAGSCRAARRPQASFQ